MSGCRLRYGRLKAVTPIRARALWSALPGSGSRVAHRCPIGQRTCQVLCHVRGGRLFWAPLPSLTRPDGRGGPAGERGASFSLVPRLDPSKGCVRDRVLTFRWRPLAQEERCQECESTHRCHRPLWLSLCSALARRHPPWSRGRRWARSASRCGAGTWTPAWFAKPRCCGTRPYVPGRRGCRFAGRRRRACLPCGCSSAVGAVALHAHGTREQRESWCCLRVELRCCCFADDGSCRLDADRQGEIDVQGEPSSTSTSSSGITIPTLKLPSQVRVRGHGGRAELRIRSHEARGRRSSDGVRWVRVA